LKRSNDLNQSQQDDLQNENLPFEPNTGHIVYLTNFFLSSGLDKKKFSTNKISSLYFMAPERIIGGLDLKQEKSACKSDIWSLGVIIFFLVFGYLPYKGTSVSKLIKCIQKNKLTFE
jgi:serine/threonine protein kinase